MDTNENRSPDLSKKKPGKASPAALILVAVVCAITAVFMPKIGFIAPIVLVAAAMFITSAGANFLILLIPFAGIAGAYFESGLYLVGLGGVMLVGAYLAGFTLKRHGFHRALMTFTLVVYGAAVIAVAVYTKIYSITAAELSAAYKSYVGTLIENALAASAGALPAENVELIRQQYDTILELMVLYSPAFLAWIVEICGIVALLINGVCHDFTGSFAYPGYLRIAILDRVYSVIFILAFIVGSVGGGVVGMCAENVMLVLILPAACAGITYIKLNIAERRLRGRRGFPPALLIVLVVSLAMSPVMGVAALAVMGIFEAFKKRIPPKH